MKNSSRDNLALASSYSGMIGGQPNYTEEPFSTAWLGFNNFGFRRGGDEITNSYLISGDNERVTNSGQKSDTTPCQQWDPKLEKDSSGFCVQASDAIVDCKKTDPNGDEIDKAHHVSLQKGFRRFVEYKNLPQWMKV